jgi:hypothetical protein
VHQGIQRGEIRSLKAEMRAIDGTVQEPRYKSAGHPLPRVTEKSCCFEENKPPTTGAFRRNSDRNTRNSVDSYYDSQVHNTTKIFGPKCSEILVTTAQQLASDAIALASFCEPTPLQVLDGLKSVDMLRNCRRYEETTSTFLCAAEGPLLVFVATFFCHPALVFAHGLKRTAPITTDGQTNRTCLGRRRSPERKWLVCFRGRARCQLDVRCQPH